MNSSKTFLMEESTGQSPTYSKLVDIKDFPDLFTIPERLENTTLSDVARTYEEGIEENAPLEFTANYNKADFTTLRAMKGTEKVFGIWFGGTESGDTVTPTGSDGKFKISGKLAVSIVGKGVNEVMEMKITIFPTSRMSVVAD